MLSPFLEQMGSANGTTRQLCEWYNKTIVHALATTAGQDAKEEAVKQVQNALNTIYNKSINTTPMKALIGCETRGGKSVSYLRSKVLSSGWS